MGPGPEVCRGVPEFADDLRGDFKDDAVAACAAERGGAVEVALLVEDEGGGGIGSVAAVKRCSTLYVQVPLELGVSLKTTPQPFEQALFPPNAVVP